MLHVTRVHWKRLAGPCPPIAHWRREAAAFPHQTDGNVMRPHVETLTAGLDRLTHRIFWVMQGSVVGLGQTLMKKRGPISPQVVRWRGGKAGVASDREQGNGAKGVVRRPSGLAIELAQKPVEGKCCVLSSRFTVHRNEFIAPWKQYPPLAHAKIN